MAALLLANNIILKIMNRFSKKKKDVEYIKNNWAIKLSLFISLTEIVLSNYYHTDKSIQ